MKKRLILVLAVTVLALGVVASATNCLAETPVNLSNVGSITADGIAYTVDAITITPAERSLFSYRTNSNQQNYTVELSLGINASNALEMIADPVLETAVDMLEISDLQFEDSTLTITASCAEMPETLTLKTPKFRKLLDNEVLVSNVRGLETVTTYDEEYDITTLELFYDATDFSIAPRLATIQTSLSAQNLETEEFRSVISDQFFDENGEVTGGRFLFVVPDDYELPQNYDLLLRGTVELVETASMNIDIG